MTTKKDAVYKFRDAAKFAQQGGSVDVLKRQFMQKESPSKKILLWLNRGRPESRKGRVPLFGVPGKVPGVVKVVKDIPKISKGRVDHFGFGLQEGRSIYPAKGG